MPSLTGGNSGNGEDGFEFGGEDGFEFGEGRGGGGDCVPLPSFEVVETLSNGHSFDILQKNSTETIKTAYV